MTIKINIYKNDIILIHHYLHILILFRKKIHYNDEYSFNCYQILSTKPYDMYIRIGHSVELRGKNDGSVDYKTLDLFFIVI